MIGWKIADERIRMVGRDADVDCEDGAVLVACLPIILFFPCVSLASRQKVCDIIYLRYVLYSTIYLNSR